MALISVAKTSGSPTYQDYYKFDTNYIRPNYAILRDLNYRAAHDPPSRLTPTYTYTREIFLANDSNFNDVRKLREYPRFAIVPLRASDEPPTRPFYLFCLSGKGWEIWKLRPEAIELFKSDNHLCVLVARSATDAEILSPTPIVFTDAFYRKSGQFSFYIFPDLYRFGSRIIFNPIEGLNGELGYVEVFGPYIRRVLQNRPFYDIFEFTYPVLDNATALFLPTPDMVRQQPSPTPPVPSGFVLVSSKPAVLAHYEGIPMNGKVVAPLNVSSGQITLQRQKLRVRVSWRPDGSGSIVNVWEEMMQPVEAPKVGCGIWALPSDDPDAKLDGYNYYSLNDIDAELVEQHIFDFFEPRITFKVASRSDKCLYVGASNPTVYAHFSRIPFSNPMYRCTTPNAELIALGIERAWFYTTGAILVDDRSSYRVLGNTPYSMNYWLYNTAFVHFGREITSVIEGDFPPEQQNKDIRLNVVVQGGIPKASNLEIMTTLRSPSFMPITPFYLVYTPGLDIVIDPTFVSHDLNELLSDAPIYFSVGGIDWANFERIFHLRPDSLIVTHVHIPDMPVGCFEKVLRRGLTFTDAGRGRETVKVLVWQPMWFSHSFTADPNYGDILATFGFKVITIASPPKVEYIVSGFQVCSAWFQNLLKRLRGTELKDAEKALLRDCVASLDGFFGAIRVTFHYDKQTRLIYMREWRLGVPFGDAVPLTTFNLQPYHEIRALKDFWSWSLYLDIIDTRTQTIVKRIRITPTIRSWIVGDVNPNQPIAFTQRKSFANPLVGVNPSSPYTIDRNLNFTQVVGHNPHALISSTLTNTNPQVYRQGNYPTRFYPLQASVTSLRGVPTQYQTAAQKFYGSQVPVIPIQFGNLNAQPIYVATIPITLEIRAKRDVPYEIIAKWGVGVAIYAAGTQWANLLPYGLADLGNLLHWTVVEFWEGEP